MAFMQEQLRLPTTSMLGAGEKGLTKIWIFLTKTLPLEILHYFQLDIF
jgi:hypothetical protein